jgi:hypothetical protein
VTRGGKINKKEEMEKKGKRKMPEPRIERAKKKQGIP